MIKLLEGGLGGRRARRAQPEAPPGTGPRGPGRGCPVRPAHHHRAHSRPSRTLSSGRALGRGRENSVVFLKSIYRHHTTGSDFPFNQRLIHVTA